jgi:hypothetical protein
MKSFKELLEAGGGQEAGKYRVHTTSVEEARMIAEKMLGADFIATELPNFDKNYKTLQNQIRKFSLGLNRKEMPVIRDTDIPKFKMALDKGLLDIEKPFFMDMLKKQVSPEELNKIAPGERWVGLGLKDSNKTDDVVKTKVGMVEASKMKPIQTEIYLDKVLAGFKKFGVPKPNSPLTKNVMVMSKNYYIIDGHHRWATLVLTDDKIKASTLIIPLDIQDLLATSLNYGDAIGNLRNL